MDGDGKGGRGTRRLGAGDVGAWLLKSARHLDLPDGGGPVGGGVDGGAVVRRCLRPSYRVGLLRPGQPCLLWVSGRDRPGLHAVGEVARFPDADAEVAVRLRPLVPHLPRAALLADARTRGAEVLRMPAGSNPSYLTVPEWAAVRELLG